MGIEFDTRLPNDPMELGQRREWESNPRILADPAFETGAFDHSAISP